MKRLLMIIPLVFLCCLGCQQDQNVAAVDVEADIQAIKDSVEELEAATNAADNDKYLSYYVDDAIDMFPNKPALSGKEAIRVFYQQMTDEVALQDVYTVRDVKVSGDLAVAHVTISAIVTIKASGEHFDILGRIAASEAREANGEASPVSWGEDFRFFLHSSINGFQD